MARRSLVWFMLHHHAHQHHHLPTPQAPSTRTPGWCAPSSSSSTASCPPSTTGRCPLVNHLVPRTVPTTDSTLFCCQLCLVWVDWTPWSSSHHSSFHIATSAALGHLPCIGATAVVKLAAARRPRQCIHIPMPHTPPPASPPSSPNGAHRATGPTLTAAACPAASRGASKWRLEGENTSKAVPTKPHRPRRPISGGGPSLRAACPGAPGASAWSEEEAEAEVEAGALEEGRAEDPSSWPDPQAPPDGGRRGLRRAPHGPAGRSRDRGAHAVPWRRRTPACSGRCWVPGLQRRMKA